VGLAGFQGTLGRVWFAPAITPASHLPSLGCPYRSCRSNQSSLESLTSQVVIRLTPMFSSKFIPRDYLVFYLLQYCLLISLIHSPCSSFLVIIIFGWIPFVCLLLFLPARQATDSGPYTTVSIPPQTWNASGLHVRTELPHWTIHQPD